MVTHSREYARRAHRAIHLFDGRVVEDVARSVAA
jgi:predicted ABC-type transport system involved in lysophospholipase L1 biosynthesis ATPase subunit